MSNFKMTVAAIAAALLVAACGGGGGESVSTKAGITSVKVVGDSLSDSGTFFGLPGYGRIFSIQGTGHQIWTERIAASYGVASLCNVYKFTGATFVANPTPGCTSYGVGGGRINNPTSAGGAATPFSIVKQLQDAGAAGNYKASELLLIDGGGNDAADLVGAYLGAAKDGGAAYAGLLSTLLSPAVVGANLAAGQSGLATAGGLYMAALADKFYDAIKTNALDKGATHIALLNAPGIQYTPRFQMALDGVAAAYGGGATGAAVRAQSEGLFKSWVEAFNAQLAKRVAGNTAVLLVDFYTNANDQFANPAQFGMTNVKTPACPITGLGSDGLPSYNFQTCTADALSAQTPPTGASGGANWWKTYAFSDGFHYSPYGYQLMGEMVSRSLAQAGWL
jgi:phospholipase/lecithinase/hemolysin